MLKSLTDALPFCCRILKGYLSPFKVFILDISYIIKVRMAQEITLLS